MRIFTNENLSPEYYRIGEWRRARETATPVWLSLTIINNHFGICHPTVFEKLTAAVPTIN